MSKSIIFSPHSLLKIEILANHNIEIKQDFILDILQNPDTIETDNKGKSIAQKRINGLVLRIVYQEYLDRIVIITLSPGRRSRYEKS